MIPLAAKAVMPRARTAAAAIRDNFFFDGWLGYVLFGFGLQRTKTIDDPVKEDL